MQGIKANLCLPPAGFCPLCVVVAVFVLVLVPPSACGGSRKNSIKARRETFHWHTSQCASGFFFFDPPPHTRSKKPFAVTSPRITLTDRQGCREQQQARGRRRRNFSEGEIRRFERPQHTHTNTKRARLEGEREGEGENQTLLIRNDGPLLLYRDGEMAFLSYTPRRERESDFIESSSSSQTTSTTNGKLQATNSSSIAHRKRFLGKTGHKNQSSLSRVFRSHDPLMRACSRQTNNVVKVGFFAVSKYTHSTGEHGSCSLCTLLLCAMSVWMMSRCCCSRLPTMVGKSLSLSLARPN